MINCSPIQAFVSSTTTEFLKDQSLTSVNLITTYLTYLTSLHCSQNLTWHWSYDHWLFAWNQADVKCTDSICLLQLLGLPPDHVYSGVSVWNVSIESNHIGLVHNTIMTISACTNETLNNRWYRVVMLLHEHTTDLQCDQIGIIWRTSKSSMMSKEWVKTKQLINKSNGR